MDTVAAYITGNPEHSAASDPNPPQLVDSWIFILLAVEKK